MSEDAAFRRAAAAKPVKRFPALFEGVLAQLAQRRASPDGSVDARTSWSALKMMGPIWEGRPAILAFGVVLAEFRCSRSDVADVRSGVGDRGRSLGARESLARNQACRASYEK